MNLFLALLLTASPEKTLEVHFADQAPRIDGRIEDVWQKADSITDFVQHEPDESQPPSERTVVWVMQDRNNLYVAFRCAAARKKPVAALYGMEEEATIFLDPMDSRNSGYFFKVYGSGLYRTGKILDNGNNQDWSWDAVWYQADRLYDDRWEVEMKIPFKSIRYKQGVTEWGVNFHRFITNGMEHDFWIDVKDQEGGNQVSEWGRLKGINPEAQGYYLELYPEAFVRYDEAPPAKGKVKPFGSLNVKWDLSPQSTINATALPDFAQIESDPYSFNLSRYPSYFMEQRPFFIEGNELFRMSGLGEGSFRPLDIFYSRRIGKAINQEPVPILGGLKFTTKERDWHFGVLGAVTDELIQDSTVIEPRRGFAVISGRTKLPDTTNLGLLLSSTTAGDNNYNYALGIDLDRGFGPMRGAFQGAFSDRSGKLGWAINSGYAGFIGSWFSSGALQVTSDSFDVSDIGFMPWPGRKSLNVYAGPYIRNRGGAMTRLITGPGISINQEPGSNDMSYWANYNFNTHFRSGWQVECNAGAGRSAEADTVYFGRNVHFSINGGGLKYNVHLGGNGNYGYNYRRGYLAANYTNLAGLTYYLAGKVALMLGESNYWETDPAGGIVGVTSVLRPKIDYRIDSRMTFNVYSEIVFATPGTRFDSTQLATNRIGFLYSWNFLPKSWLYLALNDFRVDPGDGLKLVNRVGAVKLRYLFYF